MAHVEKRQRADGSTAYKVIWEDPSGRRRSRTFSRASTSRPAEEARKFKATVENELLRGTYVDPDIGQVTFREFAEEYQANAHARRSTADRVAGIMRTHVYPLIGDMRMGAIRRRDIQGMVNALAVKPVGGHRGDNNPRPTLAPTYVENIFLIVAGVFRAAVLDQVIPISPCVKIKLPQKVRNEIVIPTPEQVALVAERISPRYRALVLTAAGSGLRSGELRALDLQRLRVLERAITVNRTLHTPDKGGHYYGPPKTSAGYRQVPLTASYAQVVAEHLERYGTGVDGLVFTGRGGRPIHRRTIAMALSPVLRGLGFPPRSGMHVFRHYYASGLIAAGMDVLSVMRLLGHASSEETLETYGHLWHDHDERAREAVEVTFPLGHRGGREGVEGAKRGRPRDSRVAPVTQLSQKNTQVGAI